MRSALVTNIVSPHQMPFACALAERLGDDRFRYIATETDHAERIALGWSTRNYSSWVLLPKMCKVDRTIAERWARESEVVISGQRDFDLFERRCREEKITLYMSERWFKPPYGMLRLIHPSYLRTALRFCHLLRSPTFYYLPAGVRAANDVLRMIRLFGRFPHWLFREPLITDKELRSKLLLWGYFVEPSGDEKSCAGSLKAEDGNDVGTNRPAGGSVTTNTPMNSHIRECLRVLWVGRMLGWKRVDTLVKAVGCLLKEGRNVQLTLVGHGSEEARLRKLSDKILRELSASSVVSDTRSSASGLGSREEPRITFHPPIPIAQVRDFMRQSDVYVLPSDGGEGWGAVVNEAMEEGCAVIATHECGAGATMIRDGQNGLLFRAGDVGALAKGLRRMQDDPEMRRELAKGGRATVRQIWSPDIASERLVAFCQAVLAGQPCPCYSDGPLSEASG